MLKANLRIKNAQLRTTEAIQAEAQKHHYRLKKQQSLFTGEALHDNLLANGPATVKDEVIAKVERLLWV